MISTKKIFGSLFIIGFISMNLLISSSSKSDRGSFTLQNLRALQASAGEIYCDDSNESSCNYTWHFEDGGSISIHAKGDMYHIY